MVSSNFIAFVDVAIVNSFIIYNGRCRENNLYLKDFRLSIVTGLFGSDSETVPSGRPSEEMLFSQFKPNISLESRWDQTDQMPMLSNFRRCALCNSKVEQHRTRRTCYSCNVGLCLLGSCKQSQKLTQ